MRLLALCHPTFNRKLHTCGNGNGFVYLGTNEILRRLEERGHPVDLVSLYQPLSLPLFGGRQLKCMQDVKPEAYDAYLHMFKDPTEPEVLDMLRAWKLPPKPAINDAFKLKDHGKWKYLPILQKAGLAPEIAGTPEAVAWKPSAANQSISADGKFINCAAFNNDRNIYPERRSLERIVIRFVDNATGGMRSIFRIGYVLGRFTMGWLYLAPAAQYIIKSGNAAHMVPFELPRRYREPLGRAMKEVGVDCCHVEGCFKHDRLFVFDLNPLPTSSGVTMSLLTEELVEQMIERLGEIVEGKNHE